MALYEGVRVFHSVRFQGKSSKTVSIGKVDLDGHWMFSAQPTGHGGYTGAMFER